MYNIPKIETSYSGNPASFTVQSGESIGSLTAAITPLQDLHGYDSPWPAGGGKNLFNPDSTGREWITSGGYIVTRSTSRSVRVACSEGDSFTLSNKNPSDSTNIIVLAFLDSNDTKLARYVVSTGEKYVSGTAPSGTTTCLAVFNDWASVDEAQLERGLTATSYAPYSNICPITGYTGANIYVSPTQNQGDATVYNVDWTSAAGTVYGGTLDALTGKLTVTMVGVDMGTLSWQKYTSGNNYAFYATINGASKGVVGKTDFLCSAYKAIPCVTRSSFMSNGNDKEIVQPSTSSAFYIKDSAYTDKDAFATSVSGYQLVYTLETPVEYTLTPQQVAALVGQNYVWSNLGSTVSVTVLSESPFHELAISDSAQTRCRIYFIGDNVDCTDDNDVQTNGTLLRSDPSENDSNSMIDSSSGLSILESFNKEAEASIGLAASYTVSCSFLNRNNSLDGFDYGRCKIYIDVYDSDNSTWIPCPLGVFYFDVPVKRRTRVVSATGYDQMYLLDSIADTWWNGLDWPSGLTITNIIQSLAGTLGLHISANATTNILNGSLSFSSLPFKSVEQTFRDILQFVAEATGTVAMFDRDGALDFRWFSAAQYKGDTFEIDADDLDTPCLTIDLAEYTVPAIDQLVVKASNIDVGAAVGTGDNQYAIVNNPFMGGADEAAIVTKATPIYNRITGIGAYDPVSLKLISDFSIEAGDIINISYQGRTYQLPIFQQTLTWHGRHVFSTPQSSGSKKRPEQTAPKREEFRSQTQMHEFEVNLERLLSRIESIDGNFTQIEQTVDYISQTVSNQNITIEDILNPDGEIWSAIKGNETNITNLNNTVEADKDYQRSYIRFLPAEPAIVLGVDSTNAIKLKLVNNVIYFFNGSDDSTDLSLAYAYFNSQEAGADRFVASESVQAGNWKWHQLTNGHFVLDFMG